MFRKLAFIVVGLLILAGVVGGAAIYYATRAGSGSFSDRLAQYLGEQVVGIANTYLVPDLAFDTVRYESPGTLRLTGVTLTAPDDTRVLAVNELTVALAEVPKLGKPIRIKSITIDDGEVNIVRDAATGEIRGLVPMTERSVSKEAEADVEENFRLSSVLVLEHVEIHNVDLAIDLGDGSGPMRIDGFDLALDVKEAADQPGTPSGPGWYALAFTSGRAPGLQLDVDGRFNVDTFDAFVSSCTGTVDLQPETYDTLPGAIAQALRERDARGKLRLDVSGSVPLTDPIAGSKLDLVATLTALNVAAGEYRFPVDEAVAKVNLASGLATLTSFDAKAINGTIAATGEFNLTAAAMPSHLAWNLDGLDVEQLLRGQGPDAPDLAGIVTGAGTASTNLADPLASMSGSGEVHLRDGRVLVIPGLTQLGKLASVATFGQATDKNHKADATFTLTGTGVHLDSSEVVTAALAARATGTIGYDTSLDLDVNAGPLEKLQDTLGGVGKLIGKVTDQLVTYKVEGTTADPKVRVAPLGIGG